MTAHCQYHVELSTNLLEGWSTTATFTASSTVTNWTYTSPYSNFFYRITGQPETYP